MPSEESNRIRTDNVHETGGKLRCRSPYPSVLTVFKTGFRAVWINFPYIKFTDGGTRTHTLSHQFLRLACLPFHHISINGRGEEFRNLDLLNVNEMLFLWATPLSLGFFNTISYLQCLYNFFLQNGLYYEKL